MKILISRLHGGSLGGAEQSAILHARVLTELGHESVLYANFDSKLGNAKKIPMPANKLLRWVWSWAYFPLIATFSRADLLNPHSREDQITLTLTKLLHRKPVVWKDPGDLVHQIKLGRTGWLGQLNQKMLISAIKRADAIYFLNTEDRQTIIKRLKTLDHKIDETKLTVIPSDILFSDYNPSVKPPPQDKHSNILQNVGMSQPPTQAIKHSHILQNVRMSEATNSLVIGTVSRLDEHKGIQYLLAAAKSLSANHANLEYWIVGDGPYRAELEKLATGLNVKFWGHQDDISPYLSGIDIFVQPAEFEGWGRNVKEAMYFGKPIIGSNVGGIASQIEDGKTGLLFEPKNVDELTKKLEQLVKDRKLRTKLGQAAHAEALKSGDYNDLVKNQILPLFKSAISNKT